MIEFFISSPLKKNRILTWAYLVLLGLVGAFLLRQFMFGPEEALNFHDWADVTLPRLALLKDAALTGQLPLHSASPLFLGNITSTRYLAVPDAILSPQIVLLRWLGLKTFALVQVLLMYALGFAGLVALQRRFRLSLLAFTILFALFNFNGSILAHLSVGHLTWAGCFLLSWFILLAFELLEGRGGWSWAARLSGLLFFLLLQGGYHLFVWCLIFLGLLALLVREKFWVLTRGVVLAVLLGAVRLVPELSLLGSFNTNFLAGYSTVGSIWDGLVTLEPVGVSILVENTLKKVGLWEMTLFVGLVGAGFLLYFGVIRPLLQKKSLPLLGAALGMALLSLNQAYRTLLLVLPLPIFSGERVASRMLLVGFGFVLVLAAVEFQAWLDARAGRGLVLVASLVLLGMGLNDLAQNFLSWDIRSAAAAFPPGTFVNQGWTVANDLTDASYLNLLMLGLAISAATAIFMGIILTTEARRHGERQSNHRGTEDTEKTL